MNSLRTLMLFIMIYSVFQFSRTFAQTPLPTASEPTLPEYCSFILGKNYHDSLLRSKKNFKENFFNKAIISQDRVELEFKEMSKSKELLTQLNLIINNSQKGKSQSEPEKKGFQCKIDLKKFLPIAYFWIAKIFESQSNYNQAIRHMIYSANSGYDRAMFELAYYYENGKGGLNRNDQMAVHYYYLAARAYCFGKKICTPYESIAALLAAQKLGQVAPFTSMDDLIYAAIYKDITKEVKALSEAIQSDDSDGEFIPKSVENAVKIFRAIDNVYFAIGQSWTSFRNPPESASIKNKDFKKSFESSFRKTVLSAVVLLKRNFSVTTLASLDPLSESNKFNETTQKTANYNYLFAGLSYRAVPGIWLGLGIQESSFKLENTLNGGTELLDTQDIVSYISGKLEPEWLPSTALYLDFFIPLERESFISYVIAIGIGVVF